MDKIDIEKMMRSLYEIFVTFDKDGSETLESKELMSFMKACNIPVAPEECQTILEEMDNNNDGVLDFGEFMALLGMIFKIRLSKQTRLKEEFQMRQQRSSKEGGSILKMKPRIRKPPPPPKRNNTTRS